MKTRLLALALVAPLALALPPAPTPTQDLRSAAAERVFADASDLMGEGIHGLPDGIAISTDGKLFATGPGGVLVFDPTGKRLGRIETGSAVANVSFGGEDGKTLYMTSHNFLARLRLNAQGLGFTR